MDNDQLPRLEVCLSPSLLHLYDLSQSIVVIIDVLRATSTICTALFNGATRVIPVNSVAKCIEIGNQLQAVTAGERDGHIAPGLSHGNSPFEYTPGFIGGKTLVLTTTNGTKLLHMSCNALQIITGSFPNLSAVCDYLVQQKQHVLLGCAAWKDLVNLEDTIFAGAVVHHTREHFAHHCDAALMAEGLYLQARNDLFGYMKNASHFKRLSGYGLEKDIRYCLSPDVANVLPVYHNGELVLLNQDA